MRGSRWGWSWLLGMLMLVGGVTGVFALGKSGGFGTSAGEQPYYVEEFRVAEPFHPIPESTMADSPLQMRLETISAVTEPFDEVEAAVEDQPEELAASHQELILQCVTVLKEMAFCSGDDEFLEVIGSASNLRESSERRAFMSSVQRWFEPGGTRSDCVELVETDSRVSEVEARAMWSRASAATEGLCVGFGELLLEERSFRWLGTLWED